MNQPLPGICTLHIHVPPGVWLVSCFGSWSFTLYNFVCLALQEITNILKCLASVVHIGNISFGAINQQSNSAFVKDPQPVHCGKVLSLLITIEYIALLKINCIDIMRYGSYCTRLQIKCSRYKPWLGSHIVLCSWARHFFLKAPLSTQVYKWVLSNLKKIYVRKTAEFKNVGAKFC